MLDRALMNLLCNAGKFTEENGSVSLQLNELAGDDETARYEIRIKDTGIGMSREFAERLFIPFERERTSTVSKIQGTGLGLAITKSIVDMMGGNITVQTEKGKGTEFTVTVGFPLAEPKEETCSSEGDEISFEGIRALLVEDNMVNMEIATMLLEQSGFLIETAENGEIALEMTAASEPGYYDVILMDIQMPVMDGIEATKYIVEHDMGKVLILTTFDDDDLVQKALRNGAKGYLIKNHTPEHLKQMIKSVYNGTGVMEDHILRALAGMGEIKEKGSALSESSFDPSGYSERELDIIKAVAEGLSNKEIADKLFISEGTVKNYISNILAKEGLAHRTALAVYYLTGNKTVNI
jgi:DNA-binding NarL/FixJ family response regulator/anti-sigma regulatory factor (Ser/Thr protein kinase)